MYRSKDVVEGRVLTIRWEPRKREENHVADLNGGGRQYRAKCESGEG